MNQALRSLQQTMTIPGCACVLVLSDVGSPDAPATTVAQDPESPDLEDGCASLVEVVHSTPNRFLWVLDSGNDLYMWRVTDGNLKVIASASEMFSTVVKLDQLGHLNRLTSGEVAAVTREMSALEDVRLGHLKEYIEGTKSEMDRFADLAATTVFERDVRPILERALDQVQADADLVGFEVNPRLFLHGKGAVDQLRSYLIGQVLTEHLTVEAVDAELTLRGVNLKEVDCQLSHWAVMSLREQVWSRYTTR